MRKLSAYGIPVISFIGYSGSGKTTLLKKVISHFKKQGFKVAVMKHDAHNFEIDYKGKDTWEFADAGADVVTISSETKIAYIEKRQQELPIWDFIDQIRNVDVIFVEGYKAEDLPKVEVHRLATGHPLYADPDKLVALVSDESFVTRTPIFAFTEVERLCGFLEEYVKGA